MVYHNTDTRCISFRRARSTRRRRTPGEGCIDSSGEWDGSLWTPRSCLRSSPSGFLVFLREDELTPGFDQIMNENRGFPRFFPRPGATISITIGESLTPRIAPLLEAHRAGKGNLNELSARVDEAAAARSRGEDPDRDIRVAVTAALQQGVKEIGEVVEAREGRFERGEWTQSTRIDEVPLHNPAV